MKFKRTILNILFWSVISAAFIGPGTVTTSAVAGDEFGYSLVWALVFSTIACIVLQEASARITIVSGRDIGQAIKYYFQGYTFYRVVIFIIPASVIFGCAAYEAGNILGSASGIVLISGINIVWGALIIGGVSGFLLWFGSIDVIAKILGGIVAIMGICFLTTAIIIGINWGNFISGALIPSFPAGGGLLILGLVGTTVVPYNLFLGSGLPQDQTLKEMRLSISIAIVLGGIISIAILIVGTSLSGSFSFEALSAILEAQLGVWASNLLGIGLLAAGFSSALTASLAAAITAKSVWGTKANGQVKPKWSENGVYYKLFWVVILLIGILFGVLKVQPVSTIILAQALNGFVLPVIAIFIFFMTNNVQIVGKEVNSILYNVLMAIIVFVTLIIGTTNFLKAIYRFFPNVSISDQTTLIISLIITLTLSLPIVYRARLLRK